MKGIEVDVVRKEKVGLVSLGGNGIKNKIQTENRKIKNLYPVSIQFSPVCPAILFSS